MGAFFIFFLGDNELKEEKISCQKRLAKARKASRIEYLTRKLDMINAEITKRGLE